MPALIACAEFKVHLNDLSKTSQDRRNQADAGGAGPRMCSCYDMSRSLQGQFFTRRKHMHEMG